MSDSDKPYKCPQCGRNYKSAEGHKNCKKRDQLVGDSEDGAVRFKGGVSVEKTDGLTCQKTKSCAKRDSEGTTASIDPLPGGHAAKPYTCPDCKISFKSEEGHKKCKKRNKVMVGPTGEVKTASAIKESFKTEEGEIEDLEKGMSTQSNGLLKKEVKPGPPGQYVCPYCNKSYKSEKGHRICEKRDIAVGKTRRVKEEVKPKATESTEQTDADEEKEEIDDAYSSLQTEILSERQEVVKPMVCCSDKSQRSSVKSRWKPNDKIRRIIEDIFEKKVIEKSGSSKTDVLKFFGEEVSMRKLDMSQGSRIFEKFVADVLKCLTEQTGWTWTHLRSGSFFDGTKVSHPDEMDCMYIPKLSKHLKVCRKRGENTAPVGFCYVKLTKENKSLSELCDDDFLSSTLFRKHVFLKLEPITESNRKVKRDTTLSENSPSFGVNYDTGLTTKDGSRHVISMDTVPALHFKDWRDLDGMARDFSGEKLKRLREISKYGFHVVAKTYDGGSADDHLLWRLSFSKAEQILTKYADNTDKEMAREEIERLKLTREEDFGVTNDTEETEDTEASAAGKPKSSYRKKVFRILKRMLEIVKDSEDDESLEYPLDKRGRQVSTALRRAAKYVREHGYQVDKHRFTTFQLRTLIWEEFYMTTLEHVWGAGSIVPRLDHVIIQLKKMLTGEKRVEHFFIRDLDIMADVTEQERKYLYIMASIIQRYL